ncbi:hypothetical protein PVAG01_08681 [Phlyctema vagabunda]|uniref:Tim44-like domain-containing protein n=1 Tax=Phlyctema vagabunda TaxID=108571 RepID=A0ABR4PA40_9HELO
MAQSLRRPLSAATVGLYSPIARLGQRCFSEAVPRWAPVSQQTTARPAQAAERSIRVASKQMSQLPSDIGLLADTFVTPSGSNVPSIFSNPRGLLKLQWWRLRYRFRDAFSSLVLKWSSPSIKSWYRPSLKLNRSQIAPSAVALHQTMYTAFAEGDIRTLRKICTDGVFDSFQARIASRPRGERTQWELVKYNKRARLVSNRAARLPVDGAAVRQAVVRITSTQRLTRFKPNGAVIPGTGKEKDVVEYVVLQKKYWQWKEEDWQVWGTTDVTTLQKLEEALAKEALG